MAVTASTSSGRNLRTLLTACVLPISVPTPRPALPENLRIRPAHVFRVQPKRIRQTPFERTHSPNSSNRRRKHVGTHFNALTSLRAWAPRILGRHFLWVYRDPAHVFVRGTLFHPIQELRRSRQHLRFYWRQRRAFSPEQCAKHLIPMGISEGRHVRPGSGGL